MSNHISQKDTKKLYNLLSKNNEVCGSLTHIWKPYSDEYIVMPIQSNEGSITKMTCQPAQTHFEWHTHPRTAHSYPFPSFHDIFRVLDNNNQTFGSIVITDYGIWEFATVKKLPFKKLDEVNKHFNQLEADTVVNIIDKNNNRIKTAKEARPILEQFMHTYYDLFGPNKYNTGFEISLTSWDDPRMNDGYHFVSYMKQIPMKDFN